MEENINFNYKECIKSYEKLGETVYQNICNGETQIVPWGIGGFGLAIGGILVIIILIILVKVLIRDLL